MKQRHIRLAKKLCEEEQWKMILRTGRYVRTPWSDVCIEWKRVFYKLAMEREKRETVV